MNVHPGVPVTVEETVHALIGSGRRGRAALLASWFPDGEVQEFGAPSYRPVMTGRNVILRKPGAKLILGAHHDIDPRTVQGASDNTASVAVLVQLARQLAGSDLCPEIVFFDLEEPGNCGMGLGSREYAQSMSEEQRRELELVVVLDVLGFDRLVVSDRGHEASAVRRALGDHGMRADLLSTPWSDDISFAQEGMPVALIASCDSSLGTRVWRAMHSEHDRVDILDFQALEASLGALLGICADMVVEPEDVAWRRLLASPRRGGGMQMSFL